LHIACLFLIHLHLRALHELRIFVSFVCIFREILTPRGLLTLNSGEYLKRLAENKEYHEEPTGTQ